jgi:hypothetical protein
MPDPAFDTPVALFVFNRPDTTARVFEAVRQARPRRLLLVADGARTGRAGEAERCEQVRGIVTKVDWPCELETAFSAENLGCRRRISSGIDWVFQRAEAAILLEDDCLPHPDFFRFCEAMLARYRDDDRVMMVSGTNYLLDRLRIPEGYCFSRYFAIWGWATWRRAWAKYDATMARWPQLRDAGQLRALYRQPYVRDHVTRMFDKVHRGEADTWDVQWFFTCLFGGGLSIVPRRNLISNIGLDGTHTSADRSNHQFPVFPLDPGELVGPAHVHPDVRYDDPFFAQKLQHRRSLGRRLAAALRQALGAEF